MTIMYKKNTQIFEEQMLKVIKKTCGKEIKSATQLLREQNAQINAEKFNKLMIKEGMMKLVTRMKRNGESKNYKSLTSRGEKFGVNFPIFKGIPDTRPLYFAKEFPKTLNDLSIDVDLK